MICGGIRWWRPAARFVERIRDVDRGRLLVAPIDVGKRSATALVCDFWGELVASPFEFTLNEAGFRLLRTTLARAEATRDAVWVRVGLEQAGHYHDTLAARLLQDGLEVTTLNPAQVKENRAQDLLRTLKTDVLDLGSMADLLIRGKGRPQLMEDGPLARQAVFVAHRRRKVRARSALKMQILSTLDLVFPGLDGCFTDLLNTKIGRVLLAEGLTPQRTARLGVERLRSYCARRGVELTRPRAARVIEAARLAFLLPEQRATALQTVLGHDVGLLDRLDQMIAAADVELADLLPQTPAAVLTSMPHIGVVRASMYGAALGDPHRFNTAAQVYRMSGLVPRQYESAGRRRPAGGISREGKVELREAMIELGKGLRIGHPDFARYALELKARGKPGGIILCALGHRANRVAFAMIRTQQPFNPTLWPTRTGGRVMTEPADQTDVTRPPSQPKRSR